MNTIIIRKNNRIGMLPAPDIIRLKSPSSSGGSDLDRLILRMRV